MTLNRHKLPLIPLFFYYGLIGTTFYIFYVYFILYIKYKVNLLLFVTKGKTDMFVSEFTNGDRFAL